MTDRFMEDNTLREAYGITGEDATWENTFSTVSIENILIYIVAACAYALEVMFDAHKQDVDERIAQSIVPTVRWYHAQALAFQYGDALEYDEQTHAFRYPVADTAKQVVNTVPYRMQVTRYRYLYQVRKTTFLHRFRKTF